MDSGEAQRASLKNEILAEVIGEFEEPFYELCKQRDAEADAL